MFLLNILTEEILKCHIKDCFKINGNQRIIMPKKVNMLNSKIMKKKSHGLYIIYANVQSILVAESNGKQNPEECYTSKYQGPIGCSYGYKLVCVNNKFSKPFKAYILRWRYCF